jgi:hypothetical protein
MAMAPAALPTELVNLLALHSSFLTALSLHYAHHGTATPVDLRDLTASISRIWQKRKATIDDIRLCVGVLGAGPSGNNNPFYLSDYTAGKLCLELRDEHRMTDGLMNENALQHMFMESLEHLWAAWSKTQGAARPISARPIATPRRGRGRPRKVDKAQTSIQLFVDDSTIPKFLAELPHAEITLCSSATGVAPLREKGRKRLREFQDSVYKGPSKKVRETTGKENEPVLAQQQPAQAKITEFASVRKSNLLDRILAKQAAAACGPAAPTPEELQRKAALQKSEEVMGVLSLLTAGKGGRVSFSMSALLQSLQASIRSPLSKEEVMRCVDVLAREVAPGYVNIVKMGSISSVVINSAMRPLDVKTRLVTLGAF